jgi:threonine/homoserine/homoserine lactone efflux protein
MPSAQLWVIFSLSLLMSLSGALMPGPLLTYTIARTLRTTHRGWLTGARVIAGHAALESLLVCGLVLGVVEFLHAPLAVKIIGVAGGALLAYMGIGLLLETARGRGIDLNDAPDAHTGKPGLVTRLHPVLAGALVSMSNPYWWIWWVTIGSAFLLRFEITLARWQGLLAFFIGHEIGDLGWFSAVSIALHLGRTRIPRGVTNAILTACGVLIIGFGGYLGVSAFLPH